jgi:hypothetical protein
MNQAAMKATACANGFFTVPLNNPERNHRAVCPKFIIRLCGQNLYSCALESSNRQSRAFPARLLLLNKRKKQARVFP